MAKAAKSVSQNSAKNKNEITEDSVLNDENLNIDVQSEAVKVLASDIDMTNQAVVGAAVIKNGQHDDGQSGKNQDDNQKTTVYNERVAEVLGDEAAVGVVKESNDQQDAQKHSNETLQDIANDAKADIQEAIKNLTDTAEDKLVQSKDDAKAKLDHIKDKAAQLTDDVHEKLADTKEELLGKVKVLSDELKDSSESKIDDLKQQVVDISDQAKQAADTLKDKTQTTLQQVQDNTKALVAEQAMPIKESVEAHKEQIVAHAAHAKAAAEDYKKQHNTRGLSAKLGVLGAYVASIYRSEHNSYQAADISDKSRQQSFKQQGNQIGQSLFINQQLLGQNSAKAVGLANRFISDDKLNAFSEAVYAKLAAWANKWALADLDRAIGLDVISQLSPSERENIADEICNQNRALATLGGVTGLMGLKGVLADTAWLLMVALRSVYQLSYIYNKPLNGREGVDLAYGILSACDLSKVQEKQVIMIALALGDSVLKNAQQTSLAEELKKLGAKYQNRSYSKQFDELSKYIDLDKFNPKWLHYLLPVGSMAVSAHYNNELIDEVLGVARATFQDDIKGLLEAKSN